MPLVARVVGLSRPVVSHFTLLLVNSFSARFGRQLKQNDSLEINLVTRLWFGEYIEIVISYLTT